ncbi:MAG: dihydrofolate reductase [Tannerella sp.]|jgi:dihydrofolate reductase|nr:dihydrofolate reductase [Tannerella sp.]
MISIIVATGINSEIGAANRLLWRLPTDMKRFKDLTTGHTVIMGRKTFESLPNGALPNRTNVVITNNADYKAFNCEIYDNLDDALKAHAHEDEVFIIGGASIYRQTLEKAEKIYLTKVCETFEKADTFFPEISYNEWIKTDETTIPKDVKNIHHCVFQTFIKKK